MEYAVGPWAGAPPPAPPPHPGYNTVAQPLYGGAPLPPRSHDYDYYSSSTAAAPSSYMLSGGTMQAAAVSTDAYSTQTYAPTGGIVFQPATETYTYGAEANNSSIQTYATLNEKMRKVIGGGAAVDSVKLCTICDVVCNSEKVFAFHLAGEKHRMKALGRPYTGPSWQGSGLVKPPKKAKLSTQQITMQRALKGSLKVAKPVYCEVCKIECNSQEAFNTHRFGKKHKAKLEKLQECLKKPQNGSSSGEAKDLEKSKLPTEGPQKKKTSETQVDLEMKKRKLLAGGVAAAEVRVCTLCNVVCNSEAVFRTHLTGQKHTSMLKKQEVSAVN